MRRRSPLPQELDDRAFTVGEGRAAGVSGGRMRGGDLAVPHRGVRVPTGPRTHAQRRAAYEARLGAGEYFSHGTAAQLLGAPLPARVLDGPVHLTVFRPTRARQVRGVVCHELEHRGQLVGRIGEVPIVDPASVWVQLAELLSLDELIIVGDYLITGTEPYDGRKPWTTVTDLESAVKRASRARGIRRARAALEEIRYGCLSPQETRLRLLVERAGLPAPVLNHRVYDEHGTLVAMLDGAFPEQLFAYEYMGDHHRTDRSTYRNDLVRRGRVEDLGWAQLDVSQDDLERRPLELLARIARRLHRAGASVHDIEYGVIARKRPR